MRETDLVIIIVFRQLSVLNYISRILLVMLTVDGFSLFMTIGLLHSLKVQPPLEKVFLIPCSW